MNWIKAWRARRRTARVMAEHKKWLRGFLDDMEATEREFPNLFTGEGPHHVLQQTTERRRLMW